ncbi:COX15/CtaA family protein [Endozoicomonas sp. SM1973]|uniref:COX15/CtaA family protein n=1 Tax=Spartinivicinus marinus TaxID=2994442 RepID=A0A853IAT7_9GAMM|nr:COX15/CtaA family protein [Spartinivicinus marinus]MCX4026702.1 COX15/CtaA family protein [Spartinivicinus marinus]NYZ64536.1 COX15/CtaA family protein [Spartinivicinus marinus]
MRTKSGYWLVLFSTALAALVVILGAYTRLVDAGLGCPDWPGCYGFLTVPESSADVAEANLRFPESPVESAKGWPEMIHRYLAGTLGLFILVIVIVAFRQHKKDYDYPIKLPLFLLTLVVIQAVFGMWTVTLKLWPQVVLAHLIGGFTTLSLLFLLLLRLRNSSEIINQQDQTPPYSNNLFKYKVLASIGLAIVVCQIMLGGWTSSNYAAIACMDFPTCHNSYWPEMDFSQGFNIFQQIGPNYLGGVMDSSARTAIHMMHRIGAVITAVFLCYICFSLLRMKLGNLEKVNQKFINNWAIAILSILIVQLSLGVSNIVWYIPLPVAVAHNACGALLLVSLVGLNYQLHKVNKLVPV